MPKICAIRTDGGLLIGSGHIRRMCILAQYLKCHSLTPVLICREGTEKTFPELINEFTKVHVIYNEAEGPKLLAHYYGKSVSMVIFDHYGLMADTHNLYRNTALFIAAIDDMANRFMDVDILFDVNIGRTSKSYTGLLPDNAEVYAGSNYQIIKPNFFEIKHQCLNRRARRRGKIDRVFICLGGTDPLSMTSSVLDDVASALPDCTVDVVVGSLAPNLQSLKQMVARIRHRVNLHVDAKNIASLMCKADLAVGAAGTMTWERKCVGLPTIILIIASNQDHVGAEMERAKAAVVFDAKLNYPELGVKTALTELFGKPERVISLGKNAAAMGGHNGAKKISEIINVKIGERSV